MEGGEMKDARAGKWLEGLKKSRLAALGALLGIVLMLLTSIEVICKNIIALREPGEEVQA